MLLSACRALRDGVIALIEYYRIKAGKLLRANDTIDVRKMYPCFFASATRDVVPIESL